MSKHNLTIPLTLKKDVNREEYLIGSIDLPASIDLRESAFLVFFPEEGSDKGTLLIRPRTLVPRTQYQEFLGEDSKSDSRSSQQKP